MQRYHSSPRLRKGKKQSVCFQDESLLSVDSESYNTLDDIWENDLELSDLDLTDPPTYLITYANKFKYCNIGDDKPRLLNDKCKEKEQEISSCSSTPRKEAVNTNDEQTSLEPKNLKLDLSSELLSSCQENTEEDVVEDFRNSPGSSQVSFECILTVINKDCQVPIAGALFVATCLGTPVIALTGLKMGMFAAMGGGIMGFATGKMFAEHE